MGPDPIKGDMSYDALVRRACETLTHTSTTAMLDARVLMKHVANVDDAGLISMGSDIVPSAVERSYQELVARREKHEPVAYITGVQEFWGLTFKVTPDVLIPRADSECLIDAVLKKRTIRDVPLNILDLGVGSGCLLLALLTEYENAKGLGVDQSVMALNIAQTNADKIGVLDRSVFRVSNWFEAITGRFDIIIANPPYVDDDDSSLPIDVSNYEPSAALYGGADGLDAYRTILASLPGHLYDNALVIFECGSTQANQISTMVSKVLPGARITIIIDLEGRDRGVLCDLVAP